MKKVEKLLKELGIDVDQRAKEWEVTKTTAGFKKMESFILDLPRNPSFLPTIKKIRKKFNIPENGHEYPKEYKDFFQITRNLFISEEFMREIRSLSNSYGATASSTQFFESYVLFGNIEAVSEYMHTPSVIEIVDMYSTFFTEKEKDEWKFSITDKIKSLKLKSETNPIGVLIHPYMSQRDVIDAIKKSYKLQIEPIQKKYRKEQIMLGKVRKKSSRVEARNKFIYENRTLPREKLSMAVREEFGDVLDYTYFHKIIKEERRKNK